MDRMVYVAMSGAEQISKAQAVNSNNLANLSTTGFRADMHAFSYRPIQGHGFETRINAVAESAGWSDNSGPIIHSGRELDVAINGSGWIAIQAPDGTEAYTRAGDLQLSSLGVLATGAGHPVLGESGAPITIPPSNSVTIGVDGTVSLIALSDSPESLITASDRIKLVNPDPSFLQKSPDGLMRLPEGEVAAPDPDVKLIPNSVEGSNVNAMEAMLNMISLSRQFEMQVRVMDTANENSATATRLMQLT